MNRYGVGCTRGKGQRWETARLLCSLWCVFLAVHQVSRGSSVKWMLTNVARLPATTVPFAKILLIATSATAGQVSDSDVLWVYWIYFIDIVTKSRHMTHFWRKLCLAFRQEVCDNSRICFLHLGTVQWSLPHTKGVPDWKGPIQNAM